MENNKPKFLQLENYELRGLDAFEILHGLQEIQAVNNELFMKKFGSDAKSVSELVQSISEYNHTSKEVQLKIDKIKQAPGDKVEKQKELTRLESLLEYLQHKETVDELEKEIEKIEDEESKKEFKNKLAEKNQQVNALLTQLMTPDQWDFTFKNKFSTLETVKMESQKNNMFKALIPKICEHFNINKAELDNAAISEILELRQKLIQANSQVSFLS